MAMSSRMINSEAALQKRIQQFYELLNEGQSARCYQMIDPKIRSKASSITLFQYENALRDFSAATGPIEIESIDICLHLNEPSILYENRDFAVGQTKWKGQDGQHRTFSERWVRDGRTWYTRATGFVVPEGLNAAASRGSDRTRAIDLNRS
jgi:hypothetical protein